MTAGTPLQRGLGAVLATSALIVMSGCANESRTPDSTPTANPSSPSAPPERQLDQGIAQRLDAAIADTMKTAAIPGVIVGIWGPDGHYVRAVGVADKATGAPMKPDFYHRIGSQTKTFTVTAVLQLVDEGKLGLDDPIAKYIDGVPQGDKITLRQLAQMQSGLVSYTKAQPFQEALVANPHRSFSPQELLGFAFAEPPQFLPGKGYEYSNTNTVLLGLVVQKVSGQSLPDFIRGHILTPLGMSHTSFPTDNAFPDPHAQGYTETTGPETTATDWNPSWGWAAGAMISTLDDMHTWVPALGTGKLLTPATQAQRLQTVDAPGLPPGGGYGLGIFNVGGWIGHDGSLPGYQTMGVYLPEKQTTLVIFLNTDINYQGRRDPSAMVAQAITTVLTPDHIFKISPH